MCTSVFHSDLAPDYAPQPESIRKAIESNLADYWLSIGANPKGRVHVSDEISWEYSGGTFFNRVVNVYLTERNADRHIQQVRRAFRKRRAAVTWLVGPSTSPADIGDRLANQGFSRNDVWKGMAHTLHGLDNPPISPETVEVVDVDSEWLRRDWGDVVGRSFQFPTSARRLLEESVGAQLNTGSPAWRHKLAYLDGKPVAASTLFMKGGIAGIYLVATVPEARGNGLGSHMTWIALREARDLGCQLAVLQSTDDARGIYEKLGFRYHCDIDVYRLDAPRPIWKRVARAGVKRVRTFFHGFPLRSRLRPAGDRGKVSDTQSDPSHAL